MRFCLRENLIDQGPNCNEKRRKRDFGNAVLSPVDYLAEKGRIPQSLTQSERVKRQQKFVVPTELLVWHKSNRDVPAIFPIRPATYPLDGVEL
jgi:hypothetical protein